MRYKPEITEILKSLSKKQLATLCEYIEPHAIFPMFNQSTLYSHIHPTCKGKTEFELSPTMYRMDVVLGLVDYLKAAKLYKVKRWTDLIDAQFDADKHLIE